MENKNNKFSNLFEDDDQVSVDKSPSFHHFALQSSPSFHHFTPQPSQLLPQSPESLWSHSPSHTLHSSTYSHSSLSYSCISSLRHKGQLYSIAVCGDLILTGSSSRRVHAWQSSSSYNCLSKGYIQASSGEVQTMLAQGNNMLVTSHKDHKIRIWHIGNGNNNNKFRPRKITTLPKLRNFIAFRPIITPQHRLITSKPISIQHKDIISCMAYYHVEGILYTGSFDKTVKAWRLSEKKCIDSFIAHNDGINDMVIYQKNGHLFTCSLDGTVKMWLRVLGEFSHALIKVLSFHKHPIYALALSYFPPSQNQNSFLYYGSFDGSINFCELEAVSCQCNHERRVIQGHQFAVLCLAILDNLVISGSEDSTIKIWKRSTELEDKRMVSHECVAVLAGHTGPVRCLGARLQKERLVTSFLVFSASLDQTFKVWRVKLNMQEINNFSVHRRSNADEDNMEEGRKSLEFEGSPVLSPTWVKRKLQFP